jgi:hypothetical protein
LSDPDPVAAILKGKPEIERELSIGKLIWSKDIGLTRIIVGSGIRR